MTAAHPKWPTSRKRTLSATLEEYYISLIYHYWSKIPTVTFKGANNGINAAAYSVHDSMITLQLMSDNIFVSRSEVNIKLFHTGNCTQNPYVLMFYPHQIQITVFSAL